MIFGPERTRRRSNRISVQADQKRDRTFTF